MPCFVVLRYDLLCYALLFFAVLGFAVLCYDVLCLAVLRLAMLGNAWLCYGPPRRLLRQTMTKLCYALLCFAMPCYAMTCFAMLGYACCACFPLLCFDFEAGPSPLPAPARKCEKFTQFMQKFDPNRKFLEKMPFSTPFVGGTTAGPKKWKFTIKI